MDRLILLAGIFFLFLCGGTMYLSSRAIDSTAPAIAEHITRPESGMDTVLRSRTTAPARNTTPIWLVLGFSALMVVMVLAYVRYQGQQVQMLREQRLREKQRQDALRRQMEQQDAILSLPQPRRPSPQIPAFTEYPGGYHVS